MSAIAALCAENAERLAEVTRERDEARRKLWPFADATEISGLSWNGFNLIGDSKSVREFARVMHAADQLEVYRRAFNERNEAAEARALAAEERAAKAEAEVDQAKRKIDYMRDLGMAYSNDAKEAQRERDLWKRAAQQAGVCMSCALGAFEPYGCTDCLNTGWEGGAPVEAQEAKARAADLQRRLDDAEAREREMVGALRGVISTMAYPDPRLPNFAHVARGKKAEFQSAVRTASRLVSEADKRKGEAS